MGSHIVEHLLATGKHTVKTISRPNSTNEFPTGVHVVRIDYSGEDDTELVEVLRGQQALIITMAVTAPRDTIFKLVRAAAKAGVPYVLPNWYGHDSANEELCGDVFLADVKNRICAEFESLGGVSSYIFLVCGFWYEFSLGGGPDRYGFDFKSRSLTVFDGGNTHINTSTWPQCGRAVASLMSLKRLPDDKNDHSVTLSQFCNKPVYISSFKLNQWDMFESVKRVTETSNDDWTITHESSQDRFETAKAAFQKGDHTAFVQLLYSRTLYPNGGGEFESTHGLHDKLLGLPKEELDEFTAVAISMAEKDTVVEADAKMHRLPVVEK